MTMVFKKAAINHRTRALDDDLVIAVNDDTNQLLRYVRVFVAPTPPQLSPNLFTEQHDTRVTTSMLIL